MSDAASAEEPDAPPVLSVIVVAWNVRELTLRCLAAVYSDAGALPIEVFVVDNASSDGTAGAVRRRFPDAVVIENERNVGFPRANNQALARSRGRYVLFLNPDTEVRPGTLGACVSELERDPDIGMVGCRLEFPDGRIQYEGGRNPYLLRHLVFEILYLHVLFPHHPVFAHQLMGDWDHRDTRDVDAICGAFMMARRGLAVELGGLPEDLFMYHEDLSFCLRMRQAGHRIRYVGDAVTIHHKDQSAGKSDARLGLLEGEYRLRLIREAQGPAAAAVGRVVFAIRALVRLAISVAGAIVPGTGGIEARYPRVFDTRRHALQLAWAAVPGRVRHLVPRAPAGAAAETVTREAGR